jgi:hypothetical protein
MGHTFLPDLIAKTGGLLQKIQTGYHWLTGLMTGLIDALGASVDALSGAPVVGKIAGWLRTAWASVKTTWGGIEKALGDGLQAVGLLLIDIANYVLPIIEVLGSIGLAVASPPMIPATLGGWAWRALPDCFKGPIIDFLLDVLIAFLEVSPNTLFGPLWRLVKAGALGFLRGVKGWTIDRKVAISDRVVKIISGASPQFLAGFVGGFFKGCYDAIVDPWKMIFQLIEVSRKVQDWLVKNADKLPALRDKIDAAWGRIEALFAQAAQKVDELIQRFLNLSFDEFLAMMGHALDALEAQSAQWGGEVAEKLGAFLEGAGSEFALGMGIGWVIGQIAVIVVLSVLTEGAWAEGDVVLTAIQDALRVVNLPYEMMGAGLKSLGEAFEPVLGAMRGVAGALRIAEWPVVRELIGVFEAMIAEFTALGEEIALTIVRTAGGGGLERLTGIVGAQVAERLTLDLGEKAALELAETVGAETVVALAPLGGVVVSRLAEGLGPEALREVTTLGVARIEALIARYTEPGFIALVDELGAPLFRGLADLGDARMLALLDELGGPLVRRLGDLGLDAAAIDRLSRAVGRTGADQILAAGATGPELTRLLALEEATLRRLLESLDARAVLDLEAGLGKAALDRLTLDLDGPTIEALVTSLDAPLVRQLVEGGMTGPELQRALQIFEREGLEHLAAEGLTGAEIARLTTLQEATLRSLLLDLDGRQVLTMLDACGTAAQLERLLAATGHDAQMLEEFLRLSGAAPGNTVAAELEQLMTFARGRGAAAREVQGILDLAAGDATRFRTMAEQAQRFPSPRGAPPNPQPSNLAGAGPGDTFSGANTPHYLSRHTYDYFDVARIRNENTFCAPGTTPASLIADLEAAIARVRATVVPPLPFQAEMGVHVNGRWYQIGWSPRPGQQYFIGQFYPGSGPGIEMISGDVMRAIARIIGP